MRWVSKQRRARPRARLISLLSKSNESLGHEYLCLHRKKKKNILSLLLRLLVFFFFAFPFLNGEVWFTAVFFLPELSQFAYFVGVFPFFYPLRIKKKKTHEVFFLWGFFFFSSFVFFVSFKILSNSLCFIFCISNCKMMIALCFVGFLLD